MVSSSEVIMNIHIGTKELMWFPVTVILVRASSPTVVVENDLMERSIEGFICHTLSLSLFSAAYMYSLLGTDHLFSAGAICVASGRSRLHELLHQGDCYREVPNCTGTAHFLFLLA